jgi:hypothetical protein
MINFTAINEAALARGRNFLETLIPGGKFRSLEYQVRNPTRDDRHLGSSQSITEPVFGRISPLTKAVAI